MKEQKLFFTRNGEYTLWEKLNLLSDNALEIIFDLIYAKMQWYDKVPSGLSDYPRYIYKVYDEVLILEESKQQLESKVNELFVITEEPKSDFNASIYKYQGVSFDIKSAEMNLERLKQELEILDIEDLSMEYFCYKELNGNNNIIDVRFTTEKIIYYKQNKNKQIINTEIRLYLDYNLALITNFSDYTHNSREKKIFINETVGRISSYRSDLKPLKFSDLTLRYLLNISKKMPSKFKFEIEGRLNVGVVIKKPSTENNPLNHDEVRYFYDRFPISLLKFVISEKDEKYLVIDGAEGKLISKAKNIIVRDIDEFVAKLSTLMKYDYLNDNYESDIQRMANHSLIGSQYQKNAAVSRCYYEIGKEVKEVIGIDDKDVINLIRNTFFFCIKNSIYFNDIDKIYALSDRTSTSLSGICKKSSNQINMLFSRLIEAYKQHDGDLETVMSSFDFLINDKRMMVNASGI